MACPHVIGRNQADCIPEEREGEKWQIAYLKEIKRADCTPVYNLPVLPPTLSGCADDFLYILTPMRP